MTWQPEFSFGPPPGWEGCVEGAKTKTQRLAALEYAANVAEADEAEERQQAEPARPNTEMVCRASLRNLDAFEGSKPFWML